MHRTGNYFASVKLAAGRYFRLAIPVLAACTIMHVVLVLGLVDVESLPPNLSGMYRFTPSVDHLLVSALFETFFDFSLETTYLGSGLIDQIQKMTAAAMQIAEKKVWAHRSYRVAMRRQSLSLAKRFSTLWRWR